MMRRRRWETIKLRRRSQQWNFMACKPIWMRNVRPFFSIHSVPVELTWIGSVPFATNLLIEKRICKRHLIFKLRNILTLFLTCPMRLQKCQRFLFEHPFTWMVTGLTGSVKTAWVRSLLQQTSESIYLHPERIVWYYSQWQPA